MRPVPLRICNSPSATADEAEDEEEADVDSATEPLLEVTGFNFFIPDEALFPLKESLLLTTLL